MTEFTRLVKSGGDAKEVVLAFRLQPSISVFHSGNRNNQNGAVARNHNETNHIRSEKKSAGRRTLRKRIIRLRYVNEAVLSDERYTYVSTFLTVELIHVSA